MIDKVKKYFKPISKSPTRQKMGTVENQKSPAVLAHFKKTDQSHIALGVRAYDMFEPKKYALMVLSTI